MYFCHESYQRSWWSWNYRPDYPWAARWVRSRGKEWMKTCACCLVTITLRVPRSQSPASPATCWCELPPSVFGPSLLSHLLAHCTTHTFINVILNTGSLRHFSSRYKQYTGAPHSRGSYPPPPLHQAKGGPRIFLWKTFEMFTF